MVCGVYSAERAVDVALGPPRCRRDRARKLDDADDLAGCVRGRREIVELRDFHRGRLWGASRLAETSGCGN
jgi:hypothetical protein